MKQKIRRALISVSDKNGIVPLSSSLQDADVEILSSSGTATLLRKNGIKTTDISEYTAFPEILDGRVKTLHPKIHGGLLQRGEIDIHTLDQHDIRPIDLLIVNLYPFLETIKNQHSQEQAIEQIDIGGVALIRAAAKNHQNVIVIVDPSDYSLITSALQSNTPISKEQRSELAMKAFVHTASYDSAINRWFAESLGRLPENCNEYLLHSTLRYGENPHQKGAFYKSPYTESSELLQGKPLSFNNYLDADSAVKIALEMDSEVPCCAIVKHNNPCGVAVADTLVAAYHCAYRCDPLSAFGGIIAFNKKLNEETANCVIDQQFVEVIVAPAFSDEALKILSRKPNVRALVINALQGSSLEYRSVGDGILVQQVDNFKLTADQFNCVTEHQPDTNQICDLLFAWRVAKYTKSNAIVLAEKQQTLGIGAGQMSRVDAVALAVNKAEKHQKRCKNTVLASDAFFPFSDAIELAHNAGVNAIIQPGGSKNDAEIIARANQLDIAMIFTNIRHFRH